MTADGGDEGRSGAARGVRRAAAGAALTPAALVEAIGGGLGIVEAVLPPLGFLVVYQLTRALVPSVVAPLALSVVFVALRIARRSPVGSAIGGAVATGLSAVLALFSGRTGDVFVVGIITNAVYGVIFLTSVLIRRPILGVAISFLLGDQATWRADPVKRRLYTWTTLLWVLLFAVRLIVEVPLFLAGEAAVGALGVARLITGVPLYAPVVVLTFLAIRAVYRADPGVDVPS